jgi:hypothetical protein
LAIRYKINYHCKVLIVTQMKKMKSGVLFLAVLMLSVNLKAQTIDQGKSLLPFTGLDKQ